MPTYKYKARDQLGTIREGTISADNEDALAVKLSDMGLVVISQSRAISAKVRGRTFWQRKTKRKQLITFTVHLSTILSAGVPLLVGLRDLAEETEDLAFRRVIKEVHDLVEAGSGLSEAMMMYPKSFNQVYVAMVRAGETTGRIDESLNRLTSYLEWQEELSGDIKEAVTYPTVIFTVVLGVVILLFTVPVPRFAKIFESRKMALPLVTRVVMGISNVVTHYGIYIVLGVIVLIIGLRLIVKTKQGRYAWDALKLKLPLFGTLIRKICMSRFAHTLAALYSGGIEITRALMILERAIGNEVLARVIRDTHDHVRGGGTMTEMLRLSGEFPPLVLRMISIGDETGELDTTLEKVTKYYDREVPYTIRRVFAVLEPTVIVFLGAIVFCVALSVFLPMYQMLALIARK